MFWFNRIEAKINNILYLLHQIYNEVRKMSPALQTLSDQVAANTAVSSSAILLMEGLSALMLASKDDPVAIAKLAADLQGSTAALAAAVTANTPAPPAEPPV